jgi:hypothetical protein
VSFGDELLHVALTDGRVVSAPLVWFPRLFAATPEQREQYEIGGGGRGLHWPELDEDVSVAGLPAGADVWNQANQALKGWNVKQSQAVQAWKAEGKLEGMAEVLLGVLALVGPVPADLAAAIRATPDPDALQRWALLAARSATVEQFRHDAGL